MINSNLKLDNKCLGDILQLVEVTPNLYENGQRLTAPNGYKYSVCVRAHRNDKLNVLIPGAQLMETPSTMLDVFVEFTDLIVRPYADRTGRLAFTATASGIKPVKRTGGNESSGNTAKA